MSADICFKYNQCLNHCGMCFVDTDEELTEEMLLSCGGGNC